MKQERLLKNDILNILSKKISGGAVGDIYGVDMDELGAKKYFKLPKRIIANQPPKLFNDKDLKVEVQPRFKSRWGELWKDDIITEDYDEDRPGDFVWSYYLENKDGRPIFTDSSGRSRDMTPIQPLISVRLDEPIYQDIDRLNLNPTYSAIEAVPPKRAPKLPKRNYLQRLVIDPKDRTKPNKYYPNRFFGLGLCAGAVGRVGGNIWELKYTLEEDNGKQFDVSVFFREPKDKKTTPDNFYKDKKLKNKVDADDLQTIKDMYNENNDNGNYTYFSLVALTNAEIRRKIDKKKEQIYKEEKPYSYESANCTNALVQAKAVIDLYENHKGILKNSRVKNKKELLDKIQTIIKWVDDDLCKDFETIPPFKSTLKKALELYNKKNPAKSKAKAPAKAKNIKYEEKDPVSVTKTGKVRKQNSWLLFLKEFKLKRKEELTGMTGAEVVKFAREFYTPAPKAKKISKDNQPLSELLKEMTHKMPDGAIHTGKTHTKDSKVVKPAPKAKKSKGVLTEAKLKEHIKKFNEQRLKPTSNKTKKKGVLTEAKLKEHIKKFNEQRLKSKKDCGPKRVVNPKTNRCKKLVKSQKKKRAPTAWDLHLRKVRAENPSVKGKDVMKLAKESYIKPNSKSRNSLPKISSLDIKELNKPRRIEIEEVDEEADFSGFEERLKDIRLSNKIDEEQSNFGERLKNIRLRDELQRDPSLLANLTKSNLPTIEEDDDEQLDYNESNKVLADVLESLEMMENEFQNIFNADITMAEKQQRYEEVFDRATEYIESIAENKEDYGDKLDEISKQRIASEYQNLQKIYLDFFNNLKSGVPENKIEIDNEEQIQDIIEEALKVPQEPLFNPKYNSFLSEPDPQFSDDEEDSNIIQGIQLDITPKLQTNDSNYPYDSFSEITSIDVEPEEREYLPPKRDITFKKKKIKKDIPLNLRLRQKFVKIMKKNNPELSIKEIGDYWSMNKEAFIEMLMRTVEKSGGNLMKDDNYINMFEFLGGELMYGGNLSLFKGVDNYNEQSKPTSDDLSDPQNWLNTFDNIGSSVADTVGDIFSFIF